MIKSLAPYPPHYISGIGNGIGVAELSREYVLTCGQDQYGFIRQ